MCYLADVIRYVSLLTNAHITTFKVHYVKDQDQNSKNEQNASLNDTRDLSGTETYTNL